VLVQQEKAQAAAERIQQFVGEIEQQIGWITHAQWSAGTIDQRRYDFVRLLAGARHHRARADRRRRQGAA